MTKCEKQGEHRYEKFDERSVFCVRCGDQKVLSAAAPSWHYYPAIYPIYPKPYWYYVPTVTNGSIMTGTTSSVVLNDENWSYTTLSDGSDSDA